MALLATSSNLNAGDGVMAATINLYDFFEALGQSQLPPGITVRLIERETETTENLVTKAVIGGADPAPGTAITEVVRIVKGQARWSLNWDISDDYLGGPPEKRCFVDPIRWRACDVAAHTDVRIFGDRKYSFPQTSE